MTLDQPDLTYIETDLPDLTQEKRRIMETIISRHTLTEPSNHHVSAANILAWNEIEATLLPLKDGKPVAIIHEGLFIPTDHL